MLTLQIKEKEIENHTPEEEFIRGTVGAKCQINFDEFWQSYNKYIVFKRVGYEPINFMVDTLENEIEIPYTILTESGEFKIGVFGTTETETLPTLYSKDIKILYGTDTHGTTPPTYIPSEIDQLRLSKQDKLVSGENIKTVNGESVLGSGNIKIQDEVDQTYSPTSENAQSGKAVAEALSGYVMAEVGKGLSSNDFTNEDKEKLYSALQNENIDKTYNPTSENAQSGLAVAQAVSAEQNRADNTFSNALKGSKSGSALLIDDVSPVTHEMGVRVSSDSISDLTAIRLIKKNGSGKVVAEYTPNSDGTVNGVTSLYPNTTLMTNTAGVIIDCEYNKDVNRTVSELSTPVRQTITVDTPVWATQPTITGTLNEAFETWENTPYFVTLKNTDGTALESGQFKLCTTLDGYASAIEQIFTLTGSSITLKENFPVDFKSISSDRTSFEMRDAGVSSIRINPKNLKSQRFVFALNQLSIVRNINNTKYLYLTDSFGYKNASKVKYYGPVGIYDGANGFLFGTKMSSSVSINQFGAKIELIRTKNGFITSLLGLAVYGTSKTTHMYSGFSNVFDTTEDFRNEEIKWFNLFNGTDSYYFANGTEITLEEFA